MTAPHRPAEQNAAVRGIVLLGAALVVGVVLLARFGGGGGGGARTSDTTPTTSSEVSTTTQATVATGVTSKPAAQVKVAVLNGTNNKIPSAAGNSKRALVNAGYTAASVSIADTTDTKTSVVYYQASAQRGDAAAVARLLGLPNTAIQSIGTAQVPAAAATADIVVIVGEDASTNGTISGGSGTSGASGSGASGTTTTTIR